MGYALCATVTIGVLTWAPGAPALRLGEITIFEARGTRTCHGHAFWLLAKLETVCGAGIESCIRAPLMSRGRRSWEALELMGGAVRGVCRCGACHCSRQGYSGRLQVEQALQ